MKNKKQNIPNGTRRIIPDYVAKNMDVIVKASTEKAMKECMITVGATRRDTFLKAVLDNINEAVEQIKAKHANGTRKIEINDHVYISDKSYDFGPCKDCDEPAISYDENGNALCEDCLTERHQRGEYE